MFRTHLLPPAAGALALTFLGCEQTVAGPDLTADLGPSFSSQSGTCIDAGSPVSWWPGEDNFDDVVDTNPIARSNGVTFAPGVVGQGFRINPLTPAGQSFMEIDDSPDLRPANFTIDLWAQRFGPGQNNDSFGNILVQKAITDSPNNGVSYLISWNQDNRIVAALFFTVGAPVILVGTSQHGFADPVADPADPFVHVALTYDGNTVTLYVNGTAETSQTTGGGVVAYGPGSVIIGATFQAVRNSFPRSPDGIYDEVEIFDHALFPEQIQAIYDTEGACKVPEPEPDALSLNLERASVKLDKKDRPDKDRFDFRGRIDLADFDPGTEDLIVRLEGAFEATVPAGSFVRKGRNLEKLEYKAPRGTPGIHKIELRDDGRLKVEVKDVDLGDIDLGDPATFFLDVGGELFEQQVQLDEKGKYRFGSELVSFVDDLIDEVADLTPDPLTAGQADKLDKKLDKARKDLEKGHTKGAVKQLEGFINEVTKLEAAVAGFDGEDLRSDAQDLIDMIVEPLMSSFDKFLGPGGASASVRIEAGF